MGVLLAISSLDDSRSRRASYSVLRRAAAAVVVVVVLEKNIFIMQIVFKNPIESEAYSRALLA